MLPTSQYITLYHLINFLTIAMNVKLDNKLIIRVSSIFYNWRLHVKINYTQCSVPAKHNTVIHTAA